MIEFKQIIGRGTRLFDRKEYFTIYDFVDAYHHFSDPEWDGDPVDETTKKSEKEMLLKETETGYLTKKDEIEDEPRKKLKIKK